MSRENTADILETSTEHTGPEIPGVTGSEVHIFGITTTSTILSTWIFMIVLFSIVAMFYRAIRTDGFPKLKAAGIDLIGRLDAMFLGLMGDRKMARRYFPLAAGFFVFIFFANLFGLVLDVINLAFPVAHTYLRPINADLNTTLVMGGTVILVAQASGVWIRWFRKHYGHYLWNFSGDTMAEKVVNVFVGWLHGIGEFIRIGSLSLRLFLNIFVGAILISVAIYVGGLIPSFGMGIGKLLTLPFWFFELLVAFLQAYIFITLSALYLREATETHKSH